MARRHIDQSEHREISELFHHLILESLLESGSWTCNNIAFQGGTSLHLVWKSPRWSEDLDFIIARDSRDELERVLGRVQKYVEAQCRARWPDCSVRLKGSVKPDNKLSNFDLIWSEPSILESVRTKVEFFAVDEELLKNYGPKLMSTNNTSLMVSLDCSVPAAQREWIYHDKLHAIADRKFVKWRDLFDIWWLRNQSVDKGERGLYKPWDTDDFLHKSKIVNAMYASTPEQMIPGFVKFLSIPEEELVQAAERDLKEWIPERMWKLMWPAQVKEIVSFVRSDIEAVMHKLNGPTNDAKNEQNLVA